MAVRSDSRNGTALAKEEVEAQLGDLVLGRFERLAALPFDAVSTPAEVRDLTSTRDFGGRTWNTAVDVDDLDGDTTIVAIQGAEGGSLVFEVATEVEYVRKSGSAWTAAGPGQRTWFKRATLAITGPLGVEARVERVFSERGV